MLLKLLTCKSAIRTRIAEEGVDRHGPSQVNDWEQGRIGCDLKIALRYVEVSQPVVGGRVGPGDGGAMVLNEMPLANSPVLHIMRKPNTVQDLGDRNDAVDTRNTASTAPYPGWPAIASTLAQWQVSGCVSRGKGCRQCSDISSYTAKAI